MLDVKNWELVASTGYTFDFENKNGVLIRVIANREYEAWEKLAKLK